ncbi:efflux RND transporter periplasmic adaptor subunit [Vibrio sp. ZSDZ34]|uniref:Efflux RND transporter periplasmic adaptor subunit n=1 Tax=Vibrio gelatinilyticus TaxID=2893468 RepID=A0A9X1WAH7_9VIBR|nr:efflux RND transporter periplasmic adaptor subunit [Vibrio gelatinilyticus]MCJ2376998.1 efflux RND transporter periplasmic adaptor subunit [Vibrio gelatinilyticus]
MSLQWLNEMRVPHSYKNGLTALIVALSLFGCKKDETPEVTSVPIKPVKTLVVSQRQHQVRHFTGIIEANKTIDMNFRIQGELTDLPIKSGKKVEKGQLLAQLDNSQQLINKKSRNATLKQAKAEYERAQTLINKNAISQANLDALESQYISAQAAFEQSVKDVEYTSLLAPFSGVVSHRFIDNFSKVTSSTKILTLQDVEQYKITITVPQSQFVQIQTADAVKLSAEIEGFSQPFPLKVDELSVSQQSSQQIHVTLVMQPPSQRRLFTGTSVKVKAEAFGVSHSMLLPSHSVLSDGNGHYVFVVHPSTHLLEKRTVRVDGVSEQGINIVDGLSDGERVVVAGVSQVHDGQQVRVETK